MKILIFDGTCAFCNHSVLFILKKNTKKDIFICASESKKGIELIAKHKITHDPKDTLLFIENNNVYHRSSAGLLIAKSLRGGYPLLMGFWIVPKFIRDGVYNLIAKHRYKIVNKADSCSLELASVYSDQVLD